MKTTKLKKFHNDWYLFSVSETAETLWTTISLHQDQNGKLIHIPLPLECLRLKKKQPYITSWHSPFNHPLPSAPHPCNHVSSYIIAFQLLTGVWPLPPNMPNLIHVFPKRQRDALFSKRKRRKKHAMSKLQKEMPVFSSAVTMQMQDLFSARHILYFMVTWTLVSLGTDWRREEKKGG